MDSNPCEKRSENEFIDRISDLHDSILGKVLSYLPVKDVIATSILSTRWKTLFPNSVPLIKLDLDDSHVLHSPRWNNSYRNFINFVDKLLHVTILDVQCVEKVHLTCKGKYGDSKIVSWVCAALRLKVKRLRLMSDLFCLVPLFNSLHGCTTLVELELGGVFDLELPGEFSLPNLKRLLLYWLRPRDDVDSVRELIAGCPVLDELSIVCCDVSNLENLYIKHPFITKLIMEDCSNDGGFGECRVVIDAPNLQTFVHKGYFVPKYVCNNVESLHSVSIYSTFLFEETQRKEFHSQGRRLAKLVIAYSSTTNLCLYGNSLMAGLYRSLSLVALPIFQNLTCLVLGCMGSCGWRMLAQILKNAPNLTVLTFEEELESNGAYEGFKYLLPSVPICLELCIKKIEICKFEWTPDEIKLIEYFLDNGRVLQELIVHYLPCKNRSELEKLSMLPRRSKVCQVLYRE